MRKLSAALVATLVGFCFFPLSTSAVWRTDVKWQDKMVSSINHDRIKHDISPLTEDPVLCLIAKARAEDMMEKDYFAHNSPDGKTPWAFYDEQNYDYIYAGENLALGFITPWGAHRALMQSPGHRRNILFEGYTQVGVYVTRWDGNILVVEEFGRSRK